jgi:hypothetical protein
MSIAISRPLSTEVRLAVSSAVSPLLNRQASDLPPFTDRDLYRQGVAQ